MDVRAEGHIAVDSFRGAREPNIELIAEPCTSDGRLVPGCAPHKSCVYFHQPTPQWQETIRVDLSKYRDVQALNLVARHVSENGKFTDVGSAKLVVQNADGSLVANGPKTLSLSAKGISLSVSTLIVSSKYSSNVPLMSLLNWKTSSSSISDVLIKCTLLDKAEIIKFHKEIFDSLLEIMELLPDVAVVAFSTLVSILAAAVDASHQEENDPLQKCIDNFVSRTFSNPRAHYVLLDQLSALAANITKSKDAFRSSQRAFAMALKSLPYVIQLVLKSRLEWHKKRSEGRPSVAAVFVGGSTLTEPTGAADAILRGDEELKCELSRCMVVLLAFGSKDEAQLVGLQTKLVRTFPLGLLALEPVFAPAEIRNILEYFLDTISTETSSLGVDKLLVMESYMGTSLPTHVIVRHLKMHLRRSKEEKLHCVRLVGLLLREAMTKQGTSLATAQLFDGTPAPTVPRSNSGSTVAGSVPTGGSTSPSPTAGSGRIKLKPADLEALRAEADTVPSSPKDSPKDSHKDKSKDKSEKSKGKSKEKKERDKDKDDKVSSSKSKSRAESNSQLGQANADGQADYEHTLRDKLLAGKQKRANPMTDADTLPHRLNSSSVPIFAVWAQFLDLLPSLTRVLCGDMSASALGATADDDYRSASRSTGTSAMTASAAIDLSSRLELMTVVTAILRLISSNQFKTFLKHASGSDSALKIVKSLVEGCLEMVGRFGAEQFNYPASWPELVYLQLRIVVKVIGWLSAPILELHDEETDPNSSPRVLTDEQLRLRSRYLRLITATLQHAALDLESYSFRSTQVKQRMSRKHPSDTRLLLGRKLVGLWKEYDPYLISLVPDITVYLLAMCISPEKTGAIRAAGLGLYCSLLSRDAAFSDDAKFPQVEVRTIQALEELSRSNYWNEAALRKLFEVDLKQHLKMATQRFSKESSFQQRVAAFVSDMLSLLNLLSELRGLPSGAEYEEERAFALTQLMTYLRQTQHGDAYVKYAHKLSRMYEEAEQYVEAGFAVLQHANSLDWSTKVLSPVLHYSAQQSRERKMVLMRQSLALFERGRSYEQAIEVLQQMVVADRDSLFDYYRLGSNLRLQAEFYEKILEEERFFSNYFFVYYFGSGFPKALRKKAFIYRGLELERIPNFIQRMTKKFPAAEIVKSTEPISDHDRRGQFLQVFTVYPTTEDEMLGREAPMKSKLPERYAFLDAFDLVALPNAVLHRILKYRQANEVRVFQYSRPFRKDASKKDKEDNEFANLWIAKNFCVVSETFPNVQRRLEVVERRFVALLTLCCA